MNLFGLGKTEPEEPEPDKIREDETPEAKLRELHRIALERFRAADEADREDRDEAEEDLRFLNGEQWPEGNRAERETDGLPCLTSNRLPQFVEQVVGDQRQNRPGIEVRPDGDDDDPDVAKIIEGVIRSINRRSVPVADTAYDNAMEGAVGCGRGFFRVLNQYVSEDSFDQELVIKRIGNHFSVYWDPASSEIDFSDARYLFVTDMIAVEDFKEKYPGVTAEGFSGSTGDQGKTGAGKYIRVAEYWYKEDGPEKVIYQLADGTVTDTLPEGETAVNTRRVKTEMVKWCLVSGKDVLEGPFDWPGKYFSIIPVWGKEVFLDGKRRTRGLIRFAKDEQRLHNYSRSVKAEMLIMAPKAPWLVTKKMIEGVANIWNMAHKRKVAYLTYTPDPLAPGGKPERVKPIEMQAGAEAEAQASVEAMKANIGIYDASLGAKSNETSGRAILLRQKEGDTATYSYIDNLGRALTHLGYVLLDLIPKIYTGERIVQVVDVDGTDERTPINQPVLVDGRTGEMIEESDLIADPDIEPARAILNDLTRGKYRVTMTIGPSFATKRMEAAETMLELVGKAPVLLPLMADMMVKNMDWPEADRLARRLGILVPPEAKAAEEGREMMPQEIMGMPGAGAPGMGQPGMPGGMA